MTNEKLPRTPIETQIFENLRRVYNQTLDEQVPERFLNLLRQLRDKDGGGGDTGPER